jgi:nucleotide-binding universal stress UspA family protein
MANSPRHAPEPSSHRTGRAPGNAALLTRDDMQSLDLHSILVASDLLEHSDEILHSAAALAERSGAEFHVIHAVELGGVPYSAMGAAAEYQHRTEAARESLEEQIRRALPADRQPASHKVRVESAPRAILARAHEVGADLIVIGPARTKPFRGLILGNTADHIIRSATVPVLVLHERTTLQLHRIVVPIDLADPARGALDQSLQWGRAFGAGVADSGTPPQVRVLYVIPRRYRDSGDPFKQVVVLPQLQIEIEDAQHRVGAADEVAIRADTVWGDVPSEEVVRYTEAEPTDLLVLGTHGYGTIGRALIGSVTSRVVRSATCPMLLVPPSMWAVEPAGEP